jgi:hypothetical protein
MFSCQNRPRVSPFVPRLEALEDRNLLSCSVVVNGSVLTITGDNAPNSVTIRDNGTGTPGNIKVLCDGVLTSVVPAINAIRVVTLGGNDSVRYFPTGNLQAGVSQSVYVDLGSGNDNFASYFSGGGKMLTNSRLGVYVRGSSGNDTLNLRYTTGVDLLPGALLNVGLDGGENNDSVFVGYQGRLQGAIQLTTTGGPGDDLVQADLTLACGSTGRVFSRVRGGTGQNRLIHRITQLCSTDPVTIDAQLIHDSVFDFPGVHTPNVQETP